MELLEVVEKLVAIFALPIAIISLILSQKSAKNSSDVQLVATLSLRFQDMWEREWRTVVQGDFDDPKYFEKNKLKIYALLNWIDWLGVLLKEGGLSKPDLILRSISSTLTLVITKSKNIILDDGWDDWTGVRCVAEKLGIVDQDGAFTSN